MDFLDEVRVHYAGEACANCGGSSSPAPMKAPGPSGLKLCNSCLEERHTSHDDLKMNVRRQFNLDRSPNLRGCFLRMLLSREVTLEPSGWKAGIVLGNESRTQALRSPNQGKSSSRQARIKKSSAASWTAYTDKKVWGP